MALAFGSTTQAHMQLLSPPPYRAKNNPNAGSNIDYSMTAPLSGPAQFPCKGYQSDFGTPAGASVATWAAGSAEKFSVTGGATHGGGSCQAALSYDKGATFTVITSFVGSCPLSDGAEFDFTVPSDAPAGDAIFAWLWYNKIGNREIYMNCATVTISGGSKKKRAESVAFTARPPLFQANLGNGCVTVEGKEVIFPNPGPDVVNKQTGNNAGSITGCSDSGSSSGAGAPASASASGGGASASASASGGAFAQQPSSSAPVASSTPAATPVPVNPVPTTLVTMASSRAVASDILPSASDVASADTPVSSPTAAPAPVTSPSGGNTTSGAESGTCSPEGQWNCIAGTSFQQCASGTWSVVMQVAAGTKCAPGQSSAIEITAA